jgi:hypothetical protein
VSRQRRASPFHDTMNPKPTLPSAMSAPLELAFFVSGSSAPARGPGLRREFRAQHENRL